MPSVCDDDDNCMTKNVDLRPLNIWEPGVAAAWTNDPRFVGPTRQCGWDLGREGGELLQINNTY